MKQLPGPGLSSGSIHTVSATYSKGLFRYTITDTATGNTFKSAENVDIAPAVGGATALVGFSASTGGFNSDQTVSKFQFASGTGVGTIVRRVISPTAVFTPIALSGGFNETVVVPKVASIDPSIGDAIGYITATLDNGTNVSIGTSGATYYETGLGGTAAGSGLPTSGAVFTSAADSRHTFKMPTYNTNAFSGQTPDALTLYSATKDVDQVGDKNGELTFETPTAYTALSLLMAAGNGPADLAVTVHYADGSSIDLGNALAADWFNGANQAWNANGRVDPAALRVDTGPFGLSQVDLALPLSPLAISRIGDANLNGTVNFADLVALAQNYNQSLPGDAATTLGADFVAEFAFREDRMLQRRHISSGFTLVELLVVIGIIALLISVLLPTLDKARE